MGSECKSDEEINDWIKDVQVDSWYVQERLDVNIYDKKPVDIEMKIAKTWLLKPD